MRLLVMMFNIFLVRFLMNVYIRKAKKSPIAEANTNLLGNKNWRIINQSYLTKKNFENYDKGLIFV